MLFDEFVNLLLRFLLHLVLEKDEAGAQRGRLILVGHVHLSQLILMLRDEFF